MKILSVILAVLLVFLVACDNNDDSNTQATATPAAATGTPAPATSPTASGGPTATPVPSGTVPPTDGTVAPQNAGSTDDFTIKSNPDPVSGQATLEDVRVGAHPESGGWDRIVFEFKDVRPAGIVEYVDSASGCGSGIPVQLPGSAILHVRFADTNAHDEQGNLTIDSTEVNGPGNSILKAVENCDFEAVVEWSIGVSGMKNFKVTLLDNPTRVVIDVKW
jgi:hypothetical protein